MADQSTQQPPQVLPVACEQCRRSKRKCDRVAPQCGSCSKASRKCTMPDVLEQPADRTKRQRMPKGFVEILEARIQQLEDSIQRHLAEIEMLQQAGDISQSSPLPIGTEIGSAAPSRQNHETSYTPIQSKPPGSPSDPPSMTSLSNNVVADPAQSSSSPPDKQVAYPLSAEAIVSLSKMSDSNENGLFNSTSVAYAMLAADGGSPFGSSVLRSNIFQDDSHISQELDLPKMLESFLLNQGETLLASYERSFHSWYPFMEMGCLKRVMDSCRAKGSLEPIQRTTSAERFHFFIVMAIGLAVEGHTISFARQIEGNLFMVAISHLGGVFRFSNPLDQVRGLLLLAIYSTFRSSAGSTWHLTGFALRICIAHSYQTGENPENIHKAFWSAFMLEQMICNALERLPSLSRVDLLTQPCSCSNTNSYDTHDDIWDYRVMHSQLHATLNLNPGDYSPPIQNVFSIYQLRLRQLRFPLEKPAMVALKKVLDQEYLIDLVSFISRTDSTPSRRLDQFCLFVSSLTIRRFTYTTPSDEILPSWPTAIMLFRAGLICLRSMCAIFTSDDRNQLTLLLSDTINECSGYLFRLCSEFQDLANYRAVFDSAISIHSRMTGIAKQSTDWNTHPEIPPRVASLPTILDQKLSKETFESIQGYPTSENIFNSGLHDGLNRLLSCISYESDEERQLYDGIFCL